MNDAAGIMARFPVPGQVKTRLAEGLGPSGAAKFYDLCARLVFQQIAQLSPGVKKYIFVTGTGDSEDVATWAGPGYIPSRQVGVALGERLDHAFDHLFSLEAKRAVIVASDVPDITTNIVAQALIALKSHDIVLGPSHDGGYYLIGMCKPHHLLFQDITWGSGQVLAQTLASVKSLHLSFQLLPRLIDIDTIEDYRLWQSDPNSAVRMAAVLQDTRNFDGLAASKE